jgi:hypothetical protein
MRRTVLAPAGLALIGLLAVTGCGSSTKLTSVWSEPNFQTNSIKKIEVLGVGKNASMRRMFEDKMVTALKREGADAVASYSLVGDGPIDSAAVAGSVQSSGCDGILVARVVDKKTVETYYPPTTTYVSAPNPYYGGWYGYYSMGYSYSSSPGYTVQNQVINVECNLYRHADSKLVWSPLSQSWLEQADDPSREIDPYVAQVVYSLSSTKIITKSKK